MTMTRRKTKRDPPAADAAAIDQLLLLRIMFAALALVDDDMLTAGQAAEAAGVDAKTVKRWCVEHGVGHFDSCSRRYLVSRRRLRALLESRGPLPAALR